MKLPVPPHEYSIQDQGEVRRLLEMTDLVENHKRNRDVEIGLGRVILSRSSDGKRFDITVDDLGNVIATEITGA